MAKRPPRLKSEAAIELNKERWAAIPKAERAEVAKNLAVVTKASTAAAEKIAKQKKASSVAAKKRKIEADARRAEEKVRQERAARRKQRES